VQTDDDAMAVLRKAGALPGREVDSTLDAEGVLVGSREAGGVISDETAGHIFVSRV
jgi:DtxR family Mn-dependent transcriptional regulator